jgi:hypothetical protein
MFICLELWAPKVKKLVDEIYERRYTFRFATMLDPTSYFDGKECKTILIVHPVSHFYF